MTRHISPTSKSKTSAYCDYGNTGSGFGAKATTAVKCFDDDGIVERMVELIPKHHFTFGRLMELANVQGCSSFSRDPAVQSADDIQGMGMETVHPPHYQTTPQLPFNPPNQLSKKPYQT